MDNPEREKIYTSYHAMVENVSRLRRLWGFALGVLGVGLLVLTFTVWQHAIILRTHHHRMRTSAQETEVILHVLGL
jgi:hypothetical protein